MKNDEIIKKLEEQLDILERVQKNAEWLRDFSAVAVLSDKIFYTLRNIKVLEDEKNNEI